MKILENKQFEEERALYNENNIILNNCKFQGEADGESALKESSNIIINNCYMDLRYPFWHDNKLSINDSVMSSNCRAALWYSKDISINKTTINGVKAIRECENISICDSIINSPEFGWRNKQMNISKTSINGEYAFFESKNINIDNLEFKGKYSFQYVDNLVIKDSKLDTKDAFWHATNVIVYDSVVNGEYLGWYASNLKFVRCHIKGTQPLCYVKNLELIDCTMEDADKAFEYSEVEATIKGEIVSIKNPLKGKIIVDSCQEIIKEDDKYFGSCEIILNNK